MPRLFGLTLMALTALAIGCETANFSHLLREYRAPHAAESEIERHRAQFAHDGDPASFRWLLTHAVENGMTPAEIDRALGESGERVERSQEFKANRGEYHQTDVAYKWGPASDGHSVVLFFREGRLIHYRPQDLAAMEPTDRL